MTVMRALFNILAQVFRSIGANKLRSFLTMFGIAWGVASLLLLIGLGEGFRSGQRRGLAELGTDLIMMWGGTIPVLPEQHVGMHPYKLTVSDADAIRAERARCAECDGVHSAQRFETGERVFERGRPGDGRRAELSRDTSSADCAGTVSQRG